MLFEFPLAATLVEDRDLVYILVDVIKDVAVAMLRLLRTALRQLDGINGDPFAAPAPRLSNS